MGSERSGPNRPCGLTHPFQALQNTLDLKIQIPTITHFPLSFSPSGAIKQSNPKSTRPKQRQDTRLLVFCSICSIRNDSLATRA